MVSGQNARMLLCLTSCAALKVFFETKEDAKLQNMYNTFSKVGGLKVLSAAFKAYVQVRPTLS